MDYFYCATLGWVYGHELKFSNLSKVFWPKEGYTKRDLLNYYYRVAEYILPYLKDRPQSLNRYPNGIDVKSFYFKDVTATAPEWVKQFPYTTGEGEKKNFLVVEDEASILWMANMGAIEMNPWNSTIQRPDNPDWCIIGLDPTEKNTFEQVIETAQVTKKCLTALKLRGTQKHPGQLVSISTYRCLRNTAMMNASSLQESSQHMCTSNCLLLPALNA